MEALSQALQGKRTLRTEAVESKPAPTVTPQELIRVRKDLKISRALFAISANQRPHPGELGAGARQAECASRAADQSRQALSRYSRKVRHNLVANSSLDQSVVVIDTYNDLECLRPTELLLTSSKEFS
jgi:hypothetical protein